MRTTGISVTAPPALPALGPPWTLRSLRPDGSDAALVSRWMRRPHVAAAWKQAWSRQRWAAEIAHQLAGDHSRPCLACRDGEPIAYLEIYRVARDRLAAYYQAGSHDLGVHIAIGDEENTGRGIGRALLHAVARGLLAADPACLRVVAEPDVTNEASLRAFGHAGFRPVGQIPLPHKTALLLAFPRTEDDPLLRPASGTAR